MVEFGARLSLKDNMYSAMQKNLKMQKQFSEQVKKTSASVNTLGKTKVSPTINAKDKASAIVNKVKSSLKAVGDTTANAVVSVKDNASAGMHNIKGMLSTLAKGAIVTVTLKTVGKLMGDTLQAGASLQQSVGGVETLFKGDAGMVTANADKAFKTAGLSANAYMETVTSFSASLLQGLGGDTAKTAQIADMAIIDMADNANKMGTSMDLIQNAYQGFAKGNYTMLDNLKLGYGGTQEEMKRLLKDAQKLTGVKYDMSNLADVYSAIHAIQDSLGIANATADEAEKTFSGSLSAMKASISNLFGNMALGGDITASMQDVIESASTFLFNNAIPMVKNVVKALPTAFKTGIKSVAPKIKEIGGDIVSSLKEGLVSMLPSSVTEAVGGAFNNISGVIASAIPLINPLMENMKANFFAMIPIITGIGSVFGQTIQQVMPIVAQVFSTVSSTIMQIRQAIAEVMLPIIQNVISTAIGAIATVMPTLISIFEGVGAKIQQIVGVIQKHMGLFQSVFETVAPIVQSVMGVIANIFSGAWDIISPIIDFAIIIFDAILTKVEEVFPTIQGIVESVWGFLEPIFNGIGDALSFIGNAIGDAVSWVGDKLSGDDGKGYAYGKNRVPYDNYPARLHEGERVLTRNQADQYDRAVSTRGIPFAPVGANVSSVDAGGKTVNHNITIEVNNPVITKEADVDEVVERMVRKFEQLLPNMT